MASSERVQLFESVARLAKSKTDFQYQSTNCEPQNSTAMVQRLDLLKNEAVPVSKSE